MKMLAGAELESRRRIAGFSAADSASLAWVFAISRFSSTRSLRREQLSSHHVQISQRSGHLESVQVLRQTAVAGLAEAEYVLDHSEHVLDLGAHPRLVAVLR